jgi:predicted alpha/beta-fold hydrolase
MPLIPTSTYLPPFLFNNGHLQTVYPVLARRMSPDLYRRERIATPDDDFLDLDWARIGSGSLAILSHGLEGSTHRPYMVGMAKMLNLHGWDALAWNYRACSGEINRQLRLYHNGSIDDLDVVVRHALATGAYQQIALIGFSLGGNLTLVYLGTLGTAIDKRISKAAVFSVPCDLAAGARELAKRRNCLYMKQFLVSLHDKIRGKMKQFPGEIDDKEFGSIRNFKEFDDRYTAPIHGFKDAEDYWAQCSSRQFIPNITIPTLIVNSLDDPFLVDGCYPVLEAEQNRFVQLEMPKSGGHVGFVRFDRNGAYWSEQRVVEFLGRDLPARAT